MRKKGENVFFCSSYFPIGNEKIGGKKRGRIAGDYGGQHPPCRSEIFFHKRMKIRVETRHFKPLQQMNKAFIIEI